MKNFLRCLQYLVSRHSQAKNALLAILIYQVANW